MTKKAIVLGATGAVGRELLQLLINDDKFNQILLISRRMVEVEHPKIRQLVIDFDKPNEWASKVTGDVLFSAFGTTLKTAGSKEVQYKIDYTYQYEVAKAAKNNGVESYVLVSSVGANARSNIFYSRMKGELDRDVKLLKFNYLSLIKPSILVGVRTETRPGEEFSIKVGRVLTKLPVLKKYRPIETKVVAQAMIKSVFLEKPIAEYELLEVFELLE